jgi:dTDP-4-amino-4,6-dideoxygalactose transaminase
MLANHGMERRYFHDAIGVNSRLDAVQASVLNVKLPHLNQWNKQRQSAADSYDTLLANIPQIKTPKRASTSEHIFHQYTIRIQDGRRDLLQTYLAEHDVPSMIYYPVPMHEQTAYTNVVRRRVPLTNTDKITNEVLSLPMHPDLTEEQINYICTQIKNFFD